jgi:hypothetical protein
MNTNNNGFLHMLMVAGAVLLTGCGGSSSGESSGMISLAVSDGPIHDADKVCISFTEIELKGSGPSTTVSLDPAEKVNLLDFQGKNAAPILMNHELPAGDYQWIRLGIDAERGSNGGAGDTGGLGCDGEASYITMSNGSFYNLYVPSGANTGLKLVGGFTVPANGSANFTAEIDLMKSIKTPPGLDPDVVLRPTIRLVNNVDAGTLTGQVSNDLATAEGCAPSVYVFDDEVTPNAIDEGELNDPNDPVATAMVNERMISDGQVEFHYTVGFLLAGDYEVAFTCDGSEFEPADGKGATIAAKETTVIDFLAQ